MTMRLEYLGFFDTGAEREYSLAVQDGANDRRTFTMVIANRDFDSRAARYQDGPDICYQKLLAVLSVAGAFDQRIILSEEDLYHYRHAHAPKPSSAVRTRLSRTRAKKAIL